MDTTISDGETGTFWPVFSDVAVAMLLILILFVVVQFLKFNKVRLYEEIGRRQATVEAELRDRFGPEEVQIETVDDLHQRLLFSADLLFRDCDARLLQRGREVIQGVGGVLSPRANEYFLSIQVEGHTDPRPTNTDGCQYATNWHLSSERATTVVTELEDVVGIDGEFLSSVGRAEFQPPDGVDVMTPEGWDRMRRIEILLQYRTDNVL